ncbi:DUF1669 domain-containing protein [bacterium]|nr:DUF1669 domain-containing protein [bacterium]
MKLCANLVLLVLLVSCAHPNARGSRVEPNREVPAGDVCFSPEEACDAKLIHFIRSAQESLDVAVFDLTHPQMVHELIVAARKIPVRVLVDKRQSKEPHSLVSTLMKAGVAVKSGYQRGIMHHKFIVMDGKALETGSFNFTNSASFKNQENQIYLETPVLVERFKKQFEKMWNSGRAL